VSRGDGDVTVLVFLLAAIAQDAGVRTPPGVWDRVITPRLAAVELPASVLGAGWEVSPGVRIDDLEKVEALEEPVRSLARTLKAQLAPLGVRGVADYTLVRAEFPLNTVTVRVFVFRDADRCRAWWREKYQFEGWEAQYRPVASDRSVAVDSLQGKKRAVAFGNVWITAHQLGAGEEHLVALRHVLEGLTRD
jgi:hypothetical protein